MRCLSCGMENPEGMKFCGQCGTQLGSGCPGCGFENPAGFAFCGKCGSPLAARPAGKSSQVESKPKPAQQTRKRGKRNQAKAPAAKEIRPAASPAERRQLTVMFCDLVGSTALSTQLDPEELREVVLAYQETCTTVIQRYEGHIAQHLGDGLLVYFGYPVAHEDDAQRAVRTSLEIIEALHHRNPHLSHPLQVRIGIHTGLVVVGKIGSSATQEVLALGETPNLAARLQGLAEPDTVVISEATSHLVHGLFTCQVLAPQEVKGFSTPLTMYRVLGASEAQSRFDVAVRKGLTPLVGREEELGLLQRCWMQAKAGEGQVVLLSGEPGIGKSRLVQTLTEQAVAEGTTRIEFRCSPYHQNSAFYPLIEHLQRLLQFQREDTPQTKLTKLQQALAQYRFSQGETLPLLAALLSLPHPEGASPMTLSPQRQKQKTQEALVAWLREEAETASVYYAWEDLHWADPSTLEMLTLFLEQIPTTRVFAVLTCRPTFTPPWNPRSYLTPMTLHRLDRQHVETMVEQVTGGKALPTEVMQQIVAKTDGVPLFVEELSKMVVESGLVREANGRYELAGPLPPLAIPVTLQDALMARLDRLATVREVAQLGATLGREFAYELLQAVYPVDEVSLQQALAKLVEAEVLFQRGQLPQAWYLFKHALIQDAAYQSLLKSTRQRYHTQIAQVLEERFPELRDTQPEFLAHHYTEAGLIVYALPYWQRAGERASQRSAYVEAVAHLTKGVELLKTLPDTPDRVQQELALQVALGGAQILTKGYSAAEVEHAYARARELCQQVKETPQLFWTLWGLWGFYEVRGNVRTSLELAKQLLPLAQGQHDPLLLIEAYHALGENLFILGDLLSARRYLEQGITLYDPQHHSTLGSGPVSYRAAVASCLRWAATALWPLGYPDQALKRISAALPLVQELSDPFNQALVLDFAANIHQSRREAQAAQEKAEAAIALSREHGFPQLLSHGMVLRGWALAHQGQIEEGLAQIHQGTAEHRATGAVLGQTYWLTLLAEAQREAGQGEEALGMLEEALAAIRKKGKEPQDAELYRLKGELTLQAESQSRESPTLEAEACFLKAIEIARRQQAKSLELRAAMSLSRLWQQQDKRNEAHQMLAEVYNWFTEGFDTKDLQEAKALLEELT